jgi:t-SNARE complex subunit (syntaxin)
MKNWLEEFVHDLDKAVDEADPAFVVKYAAAGIIIAIILILTIKFFQ